MRCPNCSREVTPPYADEEHGVCTNCWRSRDKRPTFEAGPYPSTVTFACGTRTIVIDDFRRDLVARFQWFEDYNTLVVTRVYVDSTIIRVSLAKIVYENRLTVRGDANYIGASYTLCSDINDYRIAVIKAVPKTPPAIAPPPTIVVKRITSVWQLGHKFHARLRVGKKYKTLGFDTQAEAAYAVAFWKDRSAHCSLTPAQRSHVQRRVAERTGS